MEREAPSQGRIEGVEELYRLPYKRLLTHTFSQTCRFNYLLECSTRLARPITPLFRHRLRRQTRFDCNEVGNIHC